MPAKPDCDWQDRNSIFGCIAQSQFKLFIREQVFQPGLERSENATDGMAKHEFHGCRHHAPDLYKGLVAMAREFQKQAPRNRYTIVIQDLDKLAELVKAKPQLRIIS